MIALPNKRRAAFVVIAAPLHAEGVIPLLRQPHQPTLVLALDAALATQPIAPTDTPAKRRSRFKVIQGDLFD